MDTVWITILSTSIGSVLTITTIIVTKYFEHIQIARSHQLSLKKEYFLRKIAVFEKTTSYITAAHTTITNMATMLKVALSENVEFTVEQNRTIFERLQKSIDDIYQATQEVAGAIDLYVDLKHDDEEIDNAQKFWEMLGSINLLSNTINIGYMSLEQANDEEQRATIDYNIAVCERALVTEIERFVNFSGIMRRRYLTFTSVLRQELKKYE